ncbi:CBS domain-containing protein [Piscirickettsia litoralis]|uniref:CBS domain-containing protein n=1 Tax=Piscirickettsia litoralis TaxID=1891921 RepID=UPI001913D200|nr:CBS domain-containing protein [Piscirickettsia litoralis]
MEKSKIVGVISDRDVLKEISPYVGTAAELNRDIATTKKRAHQIMSRQPICVLETASIFEAIQLILKHSISCLPVIDEKNKLCGIVSWKDLLRRFMEELRDADDGTLIDFKAL